MARKIVEWSARRQARRCEGVQLTRWSKALVMSIAPTPKRKQRIQPTWDHVRQRAKRIGSRRKVRKMRPSGANREGLVAPVGSGCPLELPNRSRHNHRGVESVSYTHLTL